MSKIVKIIFALVITLFIAIFFYTILASFSWQEIYDSIKVLKWSTIAIFITCILSISFIKATRFFILLKSGDIKVSFIKTLMVFVSSQVFTPLPGGEIGRAILFKNKLHLEMKQVATPVYLQAVIELWTATSLAIVSILFIKLSFGIWLVIGLLTMLVILTMAILIPKKLQNVLNFLKSKGLKYKWIDKINKILDTSEEFIIRKKGGLRRRLWVSLIALGLAGYGVAGFLLWYIAKLQGVDMSFFQSIFAASIAVLIQSMLFIIPGGLGVTEGGLIGVLASFGILWKKAVIITLLYRALMLPLLIIIALLFLSLLYLLNIFKKKKISHYV